MPTRAVATIFAATPRTAAAWLVHLGGVGLIPLGVLDSSVIPLPGSMDFATILLSARDRHLWFYYAIMATVGSVLGGYLTYRLARKGGKETMAKKLPKRSVDKIVKTFERWGFAAIVVPALLPPPFPFVPFVIAAGALQYSRGKFLAALAIGRSIRYTILAYLGVTYGRHILSVFSRHAYVTLGVIVGLIVASIVITLVVRAKK